MFTYEDNNIRTNQHPSPTRGINLPFLNTAQLFLISGIFYIQNCIGFYDIE